LSEEIIIEIFKEVRLIMPFYGAFDEDSVCHTVVQTKESALLERKIKKACKRINNKNFRIVVLGEINPKSIWQKSKPNRHINSYKIWWKSVKYGINKFTAFAIIYNNKIMVKEGVPTDEEITNMINNMISGGKPDSKEELT
jgi:hypothetical protein